MADLTFRRIGPGAYDIRNGEIGVGRIYSTAGSLWEWKLTVNGWETTNRAGTLRTAKDQARRVWARQPTGQAPAPQDRIQRAFAHIVTRVRNDGGQMDPEELGIVLNTAPLGDVNPALEAAIVTARYLAGQTHAGEFLARLRRYVEQTTDFGEEGDR